MLWIRRSILTGAGFFIFALLLSAVFDPRIRVLHALQSLIYFAVIWLTGRKNPWGFGAGLFIAAFWNYTNLFITRFIAEGTEQFVHLLKSGQVDRPDLLVAVAAAIGHFLMILACGAGFARLHPKVLDWAKFVGGGVAAFGYFVAIIFTTGPQYIGLVKQTFGLL